MSESLGDAVLSLRTDDRQLDEGLRKAEGKAQGTAERFTAMGGRMKGVGAALSVGLTAPITAGAGAIIAHAKAIAETVPEIETFARLSSVGTDEFQRLAHAARSVGFEGDKLSDIYKDMQDRVGDFLTTGGGPMADFFEKIAPKVGVTAEQFRKLSGPDALQLFYNSLEKAGVSQAEMTFFMEAMASDATALIPLLRENGKAMGELGSKAAIISPAQLAQFKAYNDAQQQLESSTQKLTIAIVSSGLLEGVTSLVTRISDFAISMSQTNPELMKAGTIAAGVLAVLGPLAMAMGMMSNGVGTVLRLLPLLSGSMAGLTPILGPLAIAVGAVWLAWQNWDKIEPILGNVATQARTQTATIDNYLKQLTDRIEGVDRRLGIPSRDELFASIARNVRSTHAQVEQYDLAKWAAGVDAEIARAFASAVASTRRLYLGIKEWLQTRLSAVFDWVQGRIQGVADKFKWLWDVVVGHSYIPDLVDDIGREMKRLDAEMVDPTNRAVDAAAKAFQELQRRVRPILDRLFPEQAQFLQFKKDIDDLVAYAKQAGWSDAMLEDAEFRLSAQRYGLKVPEEGDTEADRKIEEYRQLDRPIDFGSFKLPKMPDMTMPDEARQQWREDFRRTFQGGLRAAMNGDLGGFLSSWFEDNISRAFDRAVDWLLTLLDGAFDGLGGGVIGGGTGGGFGSMLGSLFSGFFATGGLIPSGTFGIVGERGPEPVIASPKGALVRPNATLSSTMMRAPTPSVYMPITIDATGADAAAIGRLNTKLDQLRNDIPGVALKSVQDAGERGILATGTWRR